MWRPAIIPSAGYIFFLWTQGLQLAITFLNLIQHLPSTISWRWWCDQPCKDLFTQFRAWNGTSVIELHVPIHNTSQQQQQAVINTSPAPCRNLFGLLTLHTQESFPLSLSIWLAVTNQTQSNTAEREIVWLHLCLRQQDASWKLWSLATSLFLIPSLLLTSCFSFLLLNRSASVLSNSSLSTLLWFFHPLRPIKRITLWSSPVGP